MVERPSLSPRVYSTRIIRRSPSPKMTFCPPSLHKHTMQNRLKTRSDFLHSTKTTMNPWANLKVWCLKIKEKTTNKKIRRVRRIFQRSLIWRRWVHKPSRIYKLLRRAFSSRKRLIRKIPCYKNRPRRKWERKWIKLQATSKTSSVQSKSRMEFRNDPSTTSTRTKIHLFWTTTS